MKIRVKNIYSVICDVPDSNKNTIKTGKSQIFRPFTQYRQLHIRIPYFIRLFFSLLLQADPCKDPDHAFRQFF